MAQNNNQVQQILSEIKALKRQRLQAIGDYREVAAPSATERERDFRQFSVEVEDIVEKLKLQTPAAKHLVDSFLESLTHLDAKNLTNTQIDGLVRHVNAVLAGAAVLGDDLDKDQVEEAFSGLKSDLEKLKTSSKTKKLDSYKKATRQQKKLESAQRSYTQLQHKSTLRSAKTGYTLGAAPTRFVTGNAAYLAGSAVTALTDNAFLGRTVGSALNAASKIASYGVGAITGTAAGLASSSIKKTRMNYLAHKIRSQKSRDEAANSVEEKTKKLLIEQAIASKEGQLSGLFSKGVHKVASGIGQAIEATASSGLGSGGGPGVYNRIEGELKVLNHNFNKLAEQLMKIHGSGPVSAGVSQAVNSIQQSLDRKKKRKLEKTEQTELKDIDDSEKEEVSDSRQEKKRHADELQKTTKWRDEVLETLKKIEATLSGDEPTSFGKGGASKGTKKRSRLTTFLEDAAGLLAGEYLFKKLGMLLHFFKGFKTAILAIGDKAILNVDRFITKLKQIGEGFAVFGTKAGTKVIKWLDDSKAAIASFADKGMEKALANLKEFRGTLGHLSKDFGTFFDGLEEKLKLLKDSGIVKFGDAGRSVTAHATSFIAHARQIARTSGKFLGKMFSDGSSYVGEGLKFAGSSARGMMKAVISPLETLKKLTGVDVSPIIAIGKKLISGGGKVGISALKSVGGSVTKLLDSIMKIPGVSGIIKLLDKLALPLMAVLSAYEGYEGYESALARHDPNPIAAGAANALTSFLPLDLIDDIFHTHSQADLNKILEGLIVDVIGSNATPGGSGGSVKSAPSMFDNILNGVIPLSSAHDASSKGSKQILSTIKTAAERVGVPYSTMLAIAKRESNFNPLAKNSRSSARGLYQITSGTWDGLVSQYSSQYPELLFGRDDPLGNSVGAALLMKNNEYSLQRSGVPVDPNSIYAAHFLGESKASKLYGASPTASAVSILGTDDAKANPHLFYNKDGSAKTVAQFKQGIALQAASSASLPISPVVEASNNFYANGLGSSLFNTPSSDKGTVHTSEISKVLGAIFGSSIAKSLGSDSDSIFKAISLAVYGSMGSQMFRNGSIVRGNTSDPMKMLSDKLKSLDHKKEIDKHKGFDRVAAAISSKQYGDITVHPTPPVVVPSPPVVINNRRDIADRSNYDNMDLFFD